ncbi:MAG: tetratricopeptide repeat protein [Polyangiaceae bacterium]
MSLSRILCIAAAVIALVSTFGCTSPTAVYGERARYSPAFHGYVMAANDGSDDPEKGATVLLLRDPLTGKKLACREDVEEWRELHEDIALDRMHDRRAAIGAAVTASIVFSPIAAVQPLGSLSTLEALSATESLYDLFRTKNAPELLAAAVAMYDRGRFPQASALLEHALAKDTTVGVGDMAYYYLGLSYVEQGRRTRAGTALLAFLERSAVRDVDRYRKAESALRSLGIARRPCASTEPVDLKW